MVDYARIMEALLEIPPKLPPDMSFEPEKARRLLAGGADGRFMGESDAKEVLSAYGLPVIRTETAKTEAG